MLTRRPRALIPWSALLALMLIALAAPAPVAAQPESPDEDGDGHDSTAFDGDDCDDQDANRYPGNYEWCDPYDHDEDCILETFGVRDRDGDGEVDADCCNRDGGTSFCGTDCDDGNRAIHPGVQVCDGESVALCGEDGRYARAVCPTGTICVTQPNRTGVCMPRPAGYRAVSRMELAGGDVMTRLAELSGATELSSDMAREAVTLAEIAERTASGDREGALTLWQGLVRDELDGQRAALDAAMLWVLRQAFVEPSAELAEKADYAAHLEIVAAAMEQRRAELSEAQERATDDRKVAVRTFRGLPEYVRGEATQPTWKSLELNRPELAREIAQHEADAARLRRERELAGAALRDAGEDAVRRYESLSQAMQAMREVRRGAMRDTP